MAKKKKAKKAKKIGGKAGAEKAAAKSQGNLPQAILQAAAAAGDAFGDAGLVSYLREQALSAPSPFLTLLGKVLTAAAEKTPPPVRRIELVPGRGALAAAETKDEPADAAADKSAEE